MVGVNCVEEAIIILDIEERRHGETDEEKTTVRSSCEMTETGEDLRK